MAKETQKLEVAITAKDDASKVIDPLQKKVDKLDNSSAEIKVTADTKVAQVNVDDLLKKVGGLSSKPAQILLASNADSIAKEIAGLIGDLDKLDADDPEVRIKSDQINTLTGDLDKVESKLKELNATEVDVKTEPARKGVADLGKSADSSKSVLANMVGNATQDLGALGGVAGSAGVAIGQMGEYMADAKASGEGFGSIVQNFATVAGPIALLSVGIGLVTKAFADAAAEEKRVSENSQKIADDISSSFEEIKSAADLGLKGPIDLLDQLAAGFVKTQKTSGTTIKTLAQLTGEVDNLGEVLKQVDTQEGFTAWAADFLKTAPQVIGLTGDMADQIAGFIAEGANFNDVLNFATSAVGAGQADQAVVDWINDNKSLIGQLEQINSAGKDFDFDQVVKDTTQELLKAKGGLDAYLTALQELPAGASAQDVLNRALAIYNTRLADTADAQARSKAATEKAIDALQKWADKAIKTVELTDRLNTAMSGADWGKAAIEGGIGAMSDYTDQHFALIDINADAQDAIDNFSETIKNNAKEIKDHTKTFDVSTEAGRANQQALEDVAKTMDTKLAAAYADSGGDMDVFKGKAQDISDQALMALMPALQGSGISAEELATKLGMADGDWEARFKLAGAAEAQEKLNLLNISLDDFDDPEARKAYMEAILRGDTQEALRIAQIVFAGDKSVTYNIYTRYHTSGDRGSTGSTPPELPAIGGTVGRGGGIAGEAGPEIAKLPGKRLPVLLTGPTFVPPGTQVTSTRKTGKILRGRGWNVTKNYANGTTNTVTRNVEITRSVPAAAAPMQFAYNQNAPVYGVEDLDRHLAAWSRQIAQKISAGRRN